MAIKFQPKSDFYSLNARAHDGKRFMVRKLNKDGSISAARATAHDWQHNAFTAEDRAEARRIELERLNEGARYVVAELT